jgi:aryl-alcohol dehydrogenase-like predicted oxidoreductase
LETRNLGPLRLFVSEQASNKPIDDSRKQVILATKFGISMAEAAAMKRALRRYTLSAVEESLGRLRIDWMNLD